MKRLVSFVFVATCLTNPGDPRVGAQTSTTTPPLEAIRAPSKELPRHAILYLPAESYAWSDSSLIVSANERFVAFYADDYRGKKVNRVIRLWQLKPEPRLVWSWQPANSYYDNRRPIWIRPDGGLLSIQDKDGAVVAWSSKTGKPVPDAKLPPDRAPKLPPGVGVKIRLNNSGQHVRGFLAENDMPTHVYQVALTPDGRYFACVVMPKQEVEDFNLELPRKYCLRVWEVASGKQVAQREVMGTGRERPTLTISPDGRYVPYFVQGETKGMWNTVNHKFDSDLPTQKYVMHGQAIFLQNGKVLATLYTGEKAGAYFWDVAAIQARLTDSTALSEKDLPRLWRALAGGDAPKARRALWGLVADPKKSVPFLQKHLKPVPPASDRQIRQWLSDLDHRSSRRREQAYRELLLIGKQAEAAIASALARDPSLEARRRLQRLLKQSRARLYGDDPERLRRLRAIEALERMGTPDARGLLKRIAGGAPAAPETVYARDSLRRLKKKADPR